MNLVFNDDRDWTYSKGCGCQVTFFHKSGFHEFRKITGITCKLHSNEEDIFTTKFFLEKAKRQLIEAMSGYCEHSYVGHRNICPGYEDDYKEYCSKCGIENPGSWVE